MPHFFLIDMQQGRKIRSCCIFYCTVLLALLMVSLPALATDEDVISEKILINGLSATPSGKNLDISIYCSGQTDYIPIQITNPPKIHIDFSDAAMATGAELALTPESYGIGVASELIASSQLVRIEFSLEKKYIYNIQWNENDLVLTLENFFAEEQVKQVSPEENSGPSSSPPGDEKQSTGVSSLLSESKEEAVDQETIDKHLPDMSDVLSSVAGGTSAGTAGIAEDKSAGKASTGGTGRGDSDTISVDFYKIDIHNVFRMLREITGKNIVIAEGISGTLTLALTDVPWRLALDIILNLKDLEKVEQGNTLVIYQKGKEFIWPEREEDTISIEVNDEIITKEAIIIKQEKETPPEQLEAKKLIANGRAAEKKGDLETAVRFYERALGKWPKNTKLANKISTTYLAKLHQNAKAVFFAKKALKADKKNTAAALNAAIGYANMEEYRQAQQYFDQSVNTGKPSREALISYAAFSERQRQYDAALRLLEKLEDLYGQDLNTMVAQARIYDSLGDYGAARKEYKAILNAGFMVPPDLKKFILSKIGNN
jgi:type IV pilus assembly protein PilQ